MSAGDRRRADWTAEDRAALAGRGISVEEAERQLTLLRRPSHHLRVDRPARVDDGILRLSEARRRAAAERHATAAAEGRFVKFVPASGAATRMFADLLRFHAGEEEWDPEGGGPHATLRAFVDGLERHPFRAPLAERFGGESGLRERVRARDARALLDALFREPLAYQRRPKALLPFHESHEGVRTALEEQLVEAAQTVRDAGGLCRVHFTVSPEHEAALRATFLERRHVVEGAFAARCRVDTSTQKPSTDTLALDADGGPLRDDAGRLVFRPGGHGALIENLAELDAEIAYVKNVDNVQPDGAKRETLHWKRVLGGLLVEARDAAAERLEALRRQPGDAGARREAARFLRETFLRAVDDDASAEDLVALLDRPARVCGVVENTGEPGGGPFWVRGADGPPTLQIVETAQIDASDPAQAEALAAATHFNPVDLVCALRRPDGTPYDLAAWIDPGAAIVATKRVDGRDARVLERPGLWNGAMAGWNTIFVEVPLATFTPVKTVLDLLRPEHRGTR